MPAINGSLTPDGLVVEVGVGPSEARALRAASLGEVLPDALPVSGLLDTGAMMTAIDSSILSRLRLTPTGATPVNTATTGRQPIECPLFDVSLRFDFPGGMQFTLPSVAVLSADLSLHAHHAILGMDVLEQTLLILNGPARQFTLAF